MHWSEKIAKDIIKRSPDKEEYVCAAGISPSGSIHIGNFRDIATSYFVYKALIKQGKKARLLFSWDEFDRFRKVPVNVKEVAPELENEIGKPYVDVKDPYGCCSSYAEHFEKEFEASLSRFGVKVDFRRARTTVAVSMRSILFRLYRRDVRFLIFLISSVSRLQHQKREKHIIQ